MRIEIRFDTRRLVEKWSKMPATIKSVVMLGSMKEGLHRLLLNTRQEQPYYRGSTRRGLKEELGSRFDINGLSVGINGRVFTDLQAEPAQPTVILGRRPGGKFPPKTAIQGWVRAHGLPKRASYPIARAIAILGHTDAHPSKGDPQIPSHAIEIGTAKSITAIYNIIRKQVNRAFRTMTP